MRLSTRADDDMYQAANLADKLGRAAALVDQLVERYEENWQDPEVSFQYALVLMATLQNVRSDVEGHRRYSATMEALSQKRLTPGPVELPGGPNGPQTSWLTDPDGYRIELVQWPPGHADGITAADFS